MSAQQVMNGRHALPPQSADVVHRIPQPHWQKPSFAGAAANPSGSDTRPAVGPRRSGENTLLNVRSGIRYVLIPGDAVAFDVLESGVAAKAAAATKRRTTTSNVFLIHSVLPKTALFAALAGILSPGAANSAQIPEKTIPFWD